MAVNRADQVPPNGAAQRSEVSAGVWAGACARVWPCICVWACRPAARPKTTGKASQPPALLILPPRRAVYHTGHIMRGATGVSCADRRRSVACVPC